MMSGTRPVRRFTQDDRARVRALIERVDAKLAASSLQSAEDILRQHQRPNSWRRQNDSRKFRLYVGRPPKRAKA